MVNRLYTMTNPRIQIKDVVVKPVGALRPHPKNPNRHSPEQIERLASIIEYQGWRYPIKVSTRSGFITSGHGRLEAAKSRGWTDVPVSYQDYETEEQEFADVVSDNAIADWAELDLSVINAELPGLGPDFNIDLLGIKDFTLDPSFEPGTIEEQGKLDEKKFVFMLCPHCGEKFEQGQATIIKD